MDGAKKIKFILDSMEALRKYEEDVSAMKKDHPGLATDHIPDTVNVLTKSDLAVYSDHKGKLPCNVISRLLLGRNKFLIYAGLMLRLPFFSFLFVGIPKKPPKTGYSAFTQEKLSSGKLKEIEPLGTI